MRVKTEKAIAWIRHFFISSGEMKLPFSPLYAALLCVSFLLIAARFVKLFTYPEEYINDEMFEIYEAVLKYSGIHGFFLPGSANGSAGSLLNQLSCFFVPLIREKIEFYRLITAVTDVIFIYGVFLLSSLLFDRQTGIIAVFISSVSFWDFFNARLFLPNMLVPVLAVYSLFFTAKSYVASKKYIIPAFFLFLAGLNTYIGFFFVFPVLLYFIYEYEKERENNAARGRTALIFTAAALIAGVYILMTTNIMTRVLDITGLKPQGFSEIVPANILNLKLFFIPGSQYPETYPAQLPVLNAVEAVLLLAGVMALFFNFRKKESRMLVFMMLVFIIPLFVSKTTHQLRIIQAEIPVFIISAYALRFIGSKFRNIPVLPIALAMSVMYIFSVRVYFSEFQKQRQIDLINKDIAVYLNGRYGDDVKYLDVFDFDEKERTVCRLKSGYAHCGAPGYIAVKMEGFWRNEVLKILEKERIKDIKIFFSNLNNDQKRYPAMLVAVPYNSDSGGMFMLYAGELGKIMEFRKNNTPDDTIKFAVSCFSGSPGDALLNTLIKRVVAEAYLGKNDFLDAARAYVSEKFPSFTPPDYCLKASKCFYLVNEKKDAEIFYNKYLEGRKILEPQKGNN